MTQFFLNIYNFLQRHRGWGAASIVLLTIGLVLLVSRLHYKEDIADFLPLDDQHRQELAVYQDISGAQRLFAVFQYRDSTKADAEEAEQAIDLFVENVEKADTAHVLKSIVSQVDAEKMAEMADFVYANMPYFLTEADYKRMDSLLAQPNYMGEQMERSRQMLMLPTGGALTQSVERDPLGLFNPVMQRLQTTSGEMNYEMQDGYIFSPDMKRAFVMMESPFGASETENNAQLLQLLQSAADSTEAQVKNVSVHFFGGPVIAVDNAHQIKKDSVLAVSIAIVLILALLFYTFRRVWNLLLIVVSVGWGWLFAVGGLSLVHNDVSIIVLGISSIILGIAVNYPLHFIAHLQHTPDKRRALREIVMPLLVGNVTTVGAFLALVPLQSIALRDLGIFASFLLMGTILFVLIYLPHLTKVRQDAQPHHTLLGKLGNISLESKPWIVGIVVVLTLIFGWFSFDTKFDANMAHINYMTEQQRADMDYFQHQMLQAGKGQSVYAISSSTKSMDEALDKSKHLQQTVEQLTASGLIKKHKGCADFIVSKSEQQKRLSLWQDFVRRHADLPTQLATAATQAGFSPDAFTGFSEIWSGHYAPQSIDYFAPLTSQAFASCFSSHEGDYNVVDVFTVDDNQVKQVEEKLTQKGVHSFDVVSMNSAIANNLSDNFNYIGWACGFIVFFFLWLSFGNLELALLSFVPMAVSWLWILGIMSLFDIQFNIVNVILATFIFGQGDDYTIFMTEGAIYEYTHRRPMLASYKHSIIISALIMFIGIGTLIVAQHPAMKSLAQVTIAGMFSVVLMAYLFPPLIFKMLVNARGGAERLRPLSLRPLVVMAYCGTIFFAELLTGYVVGFVFFKLMRANERRRRIFRKYVTACFRFNMRHIPTARFVVDNQSGETFDHPAIVVSNHQSMLDSSMFLAISDKFVFVSNPHVATNRMVGQILRWCGHIALHEKNEGLDIERVRHYTDLGYSVVVFAEGVRNGRSSIRRFHKGAFQAAEQLGLDIVPVILHGVNYVLPRNSVQVFPGTLTLSIRERIRPADAAWGEGYVERTRRVHRYYVKEYAQLAAQKETAAYFAPLLIDRYRYRDIEVVKALRKRLKQYGRYAQWIDSPQAHADTLIINDGPGDFALLYALVHHSVKVWVVEPNEETANMIRYAAEGVAPNLRLASTLAEAEAQIQGAAAQCFAFDTLETSLPYTLIKPLQ